MNAASPSTRHSDAIKRLITVPGVSLMTATSFIAAVGDVRRFHEPRKLVSYLGLDPKVRQSGIGAARHGRISNRAPRRCVRCSPRRPSSPSAPPVRCARSPSVSARAAAARSRSSASGVTVSSSWPIASSIAAPGRLRQTGPWRWMFAPAYLCRARRPQLNTKPRQNRAYSSGVIRLTACRARSAGRARRSPPLGGHGATRTGRVCGWCCRSPRRVLGSVLCGLRVRAAGLVRVPARSSSPSACPVDPGLRPVLGAESGNGLLELFAEIVETIRFCVIDGCTDRRDQTAVGCQQGRGHDERTREQWLRG